MEGALAQLVEQWTENPCVPSSNLGGTTKKPQHSFVGAFPFYLRCFHLRKLRD